MRGRFRLTPILAAIIVCAGCLGIQAALTRHDRSDQNAEKYLRSVWLAKPGERVVFWPKS